MTIRFTHLKIAGFKSFSDPITLEILPGLTGIIGPNGCGKSNIVEAIRWVMGESSAKSLRGGEMDDVIFAGTTRRAARNIAEVSLTLEGAQNIGPAPFQQQDQLQISRQLERGSGSQYRINSKVQRARDVQTFFADLGSGPRSSAIISQNRIAQLISASPEERRQVLEEAAGIAGLYSRRREAELKLKATEENLARLDDLQQQLILLIQSLNEQSSQATIYRRLSAELRDTETALQSLYFQRAIRSLRLFEQKHIQAQTIQTDSELSYKKQQAELNIIEEKLPQVRQQETQIRAKWDGQRRETRLIQEQENKISEQLRQLQERITEATEQHLSTATRVKKTQSDLNQIHENLKNTEQTLLDHPAKIQDSQKKITVFENQLATINTDIQEQEKILAEQQQQYQNITQQYHQAKHAHQHAEQEYQKLSHEYELCLEQLPQEVTIQSLANIEQQAQKQVQELQTQKQHINTQLNEAKLQASNALHHAQQTEHTYTQLAQKIRQETQTLDQLISNQNNLKSQLLSLEKQTLTEDIRTQFTGELSILQKKLFETKETAQSATQAHQDAIQKLLETQARFQQATQTFENRQNNLASAQHAFAQAQKNTNRLAEQIEKAKSIRVDPKLLENKKTEFTQQQNEVKTLQKTVETLSLQHQQITETAEVTQKALYQHEAELQKLHAKQDGLAQALSHDQGIQNNASLPAVLESITIPTEWIVGIAALFDERLESPLSSETPTGWVAMSPSNSSFPQHVRKLSQIIKPSPALQRAFDHIGVVETVEEGETFFQNLTFGQSLITQQGDVWRWDGYHQKAGVQNKAAQRLLQRETLKQTQELLAELEQQYPALQTQYQEAITQQQTLKRQLTEKQADYKTSEQSFQKIQQEFLNLKNRDQAAQTQFEALEPAYLQAQQDFIDKQTNLDVAQQKALLPKPDPIIVKSCQDDVQHAKEALNQAQQNSQNLEIQLSELKDLQQKRLNEDQQNHLRIETTQDKLSQLKIEIEQKQKNLLQDQTQHNQQEKPEQALAAKEAAQQNVHALEQQLTELQKSLERAEEAFSEAKIKYQKIKDTYIQQNSRIEILKPRCDEAKKHLDATQKDINEAETLYATRPELEHTQSKLHSFQEIYRANKEQEEQERLAYHLLLSEKENLIKQKASLEEQSKDWQERLLQAQDEEKRTLAKITLLQSDFNDLNEQLPQLIQKETILKELEEQANQLYQQAQQQLLQLEQNRIQAQKQLQQTEQNATKARENLLKAQAKQEQAEALFEQLKTNIEPAIQEYARQQSDLDISDASERKLKSTISEHTAERNALGAVNLRAEIEREEKQEQLSVIEKEYTELSLAIQQLRESIQKLNQQGKEKLSAIFTEVNQHFQDLFTRMFNGGSAYLKLLAHEDPLQSGLEIYAQPPGKKLSTLSLLSGGEQALTALSLVFAVSRCNPVPICILDEVDAPLDDPNVERFCALITDMTEQSGTRFLVVTHHQLTMSHMNRLYGVTMQERGVSQIISIDLEHAVQMQQEKYTEQLDLI
ncbi:AAA family ATPase [Commensalibacter papalotli (ex Servin-Garciduenas et al. 2014)]|uniref:Chromosome partition protein Smc n=1 Tax=Commensalibacter papalotli (ex Servin-Garciduenas et al. 2014) TaxID=1208583 RepID=W7E5T5_9PROT|nr:AAA family ATPase [Commensalibacter papalotli (ex Servin-Garciduenas et al. 2014)]EUK18441.1 chromosome segregation protein SMC [Commensalibacter papalotli (ex Servin-Garciduenas et al. 2014)]